MGIQKNLAIAALVLTSPMAGAVSFDFTNLGIENTNLGPTVVENGVLAEGLYITFDNPADLWLRNVTNDHGLGVCSEGTRACRNQGGDVNELDNADGAEGIRLTNPYESGRWTSLWVSSLDSNGGAPIAESGTLVWSNCATFYDCAYGYFSFSYGDFGSSVEGDILTLAAAAGFDPFAKYLLFLAGNLSDTAGDDNDYLVWKGTVVDTPEPASVALLGLGLLGLGLARRRKQI